MVLNVLNRNFFKFPLFWSLDFETYISTQVSVPLSPFIHLQYLPHLSSLILKHPFSVLIFMPSLMGLLRPGTHLFLLRFSFKGISLC